jgi:glycosyltransferase involved in cell wall biosynthesis
VTGPTVHAVLPADVADGALPSGGNTYDLRVCDGLAARGWTVRRVLTAGSWPAPDAAARAALARELAALPDRAVVLLDGLVACGVPDVVVPEAGRLRLVVLVHMPLADDPAPDDGTRADLDARERTVLRAAHAVVATSPWSARRIAAHHGLDPDRVHIAPPGTDPAPLAPGTDGASRLLCVAAVTVTKGQDVLVEALAGIADLPWCCVLVGSLHREPGQVARLRDAIRAHGLGDRVVLAGPRTGAALAAAYAEADLLVLASRTETYGMVVAEALARGIPALATEAGALPATLGRGPRHGVPGLLVPPGDAAALAAALRRWLTDDRLRHRLRAAARERRRALAGWDATSRALADALGRAA